MYDERDLVILSRAILKADEFAKHGPEYRPLHRKYQTDLRDNLKGRFNKVAILDKWNYTEPSQCVFHLEQLTKTGSEIPENIRHICSTDLWVQEDFTELILAAAGNNDSMGKLLKELQEPRPSGSSCIPWLGETEMKERIVKLCAKGTIAINVRNSSMLQANAGEAEDAAYRRMRSNVAYSGRQLDEVFLLLPSATPTTGGTAISTDQGGVTVTPPPSGGATGPSSGNNGDMPGSLWGDGGTPPAPTGGDGGSTPPPQANRLNRKKEKTSALNHIGQLELWGIGPATPVQEITLRIASSNGAQLKDLLKKLPDGLTFDLSLEQEEK
jgi:hypothetical protein